MSKEINRTFIGAFVLGAITLWLTTVFLLASGGFFRERSQHLLYFHGEAQGLQVGAPVVFLGVKIGTVKAIQLGLDTTNEHFLVPVTIEVDVGTIQTSSGTSVDLQDPATIRNLVDRGLRAQLKTQSLLTGQLYVDLNFHPDKPASFQARDKGVSEIPTIPTQGGELTAMLKDFPMEKFLADLTAISSAINRLTSSEQSHNIPIRLDRILATLESLTATMDTAANPLLTGIQTNLTELRQTLISIRAASKQAGTALDRFSALTQEGAIIARRVAGAGQQVEGAAQSMKELTSEDSPTIQHLNSALLEISRLSRAMRLLAETLEQQPEAIITGKRGQENE